MSGSLDTSLQQILKDFMMIQRATVTSEVYFVQENVPRTLEALQLVGKIQQSLIKEMNKMAKSKNHKVIKSIPSAPPKNNQGVKPSKGNVQKGNATFDKSGSSDK